MQDIKEWDNQECSTCPNSYPKYVEEIGGIRWTCNLHWSVGCVNPELRKDLKDILTSGT